MTNRADQYRYLKRALAELSVKMPGRYYAPDDFVRTPPTVSRAEKEIKKLERIVTRHESAVRRKWQSKHRTMEKALVLVRRAVHFEEPDVAVKKVEAFSIRYAHLLKEER